MVSGTTHDRDEFLYKRVNCHHVTFLHDLVCRKYPRRRVTNPNTLTEIRHAGFRCGKGIAMVRTARTASCPRSPTGAPLPPPSTAAPANKGVPSAIPILAVYTGAPQCRRCLTSVCWGWSTIVDHQLVRRAPRNVGMLPAAWLSPKTYSNYTNP